jgi:hypothetical protein
MKSDDLDLDLDVEERRFLRDGYLGVQPPPAKKDFMMGALSVRLPGALAPVPPGTPTERPGGGGQLPEAGLAQGELQNVLLAKLLGGALVVGALGFGLGMAVSRQGSTGSAQARGAGTTTAINERDLRAETAVDGLALADLEPEPDLPAVPQPAEHAPPSGVVHKQLEQAPPAPLSFYEELSYVRRAQTALAGGNAALALGLMRSLAELRSDGALLAERGVTEVLALCALNRESEARGVAEQVRAHKDGSMYAARLQKTCASVTEGGAEVDDSGDEPSETATSTEQATRRMQ